MYNTQTFYGVRGRAGSMMNGERSQRPQSEEGIL